MRALLLAAALVLPMMLASAQECQMTTSRPEVDTGLPLGAAPRFYADHDCSHAECFPWDMWVYQESNGIPGLQRNDDAHSDNCDGAAGPGDTLLF